MQNFLLLAFIHFIAVITPGQSIIASTRYAIKNSYKGIVKFSAGIAAADSLYIILAMYGFTEFILKNKIATICFYALSSLYLLYLTASILIEKKEHFLKKVSQIGSADAVLIKKAKFTSPFMQGFLVTLFNPEVGLFYSSLIARFTTPYSTFIYLVLIWAYMTLATFVFFYLISFLFARYQKFAIKYFFEVEKFFSLFLLYISYHLIAEIIKMI